MSDSENLPLSVRRGLRAPDRFQALHPGVPEHLWRLLDGWIEDAFYDDALGDRILAFLKLTCPDERRSLRHIQDMKRFAPDDFLDVLDVRLRVGDANAKDLEDILEIGGSFWAVAQDGRGLLERVPDEERAAFEESTQSADRITDELREAWAAAYGRNPDAADAWDHAIQAVEAALWPLVEPRNQSATLGSMLAVLRNAPNKWTLVIGDLDAFVGAISTIWPNPGRHGSGDGPKPTHVQARSAVRTAVWIVGQVRDRAFATSANVERV